MSLLKQGKFAQAESALRAVHELSTRVRGAEHPDTLRNMGNLATSLSIQGKVTDCVRIERELLKVQKRVLGPENPETLMTEGTLAANLAHLGKHGEAETILREVLAVQKRVLGVEHLNTLRSADSVAAVLLRQDKHAEALPILQTTLASYQRIHGPAHQITLEAARSLDQVCARIRAEPPNEAPAAPLAAHIARPLPAGTRVQVQRLIASPNYNGQHARVLSFDARTGRYVVALDDGKELSLKAACVTQTGCAAAGCTSEEASTVCGRCLTVRYCSRECQRAGWKAHKPVCVAANAQG
jgi:hypothetical protein